MPMFGAEEARNFWCEKSASTVHRLSVNFLSSPQHRRYLPLPDRNLSSLLPLSLPSLHSGVCVAALLSPGPRRCRGYGADKVKLPTRVTINQVERQEARGKRQRRKRPERVGRSGSTRKRPTRV